MPGPLDFLYSPPAPDAASAGPGVATDNSPLGFIYQPPAERSADDLIQRGQFAGRDWKDTEGALKKAGYQASPELAKQYEQHRALTAERESQGTGVGTFEQFRRASIPFLSDVQNLRRDQSFHDANERFQKGEATPDDIKTIATFQRRAEADQTVAKNPAGAYVSALGAVPKVLGEAYGAGKVLGLGGKTLGVGQVARAPLAAAQNASRGQAVLSYAGKQALMTPLMPSMYVEKAAEINNRENRDPTDIRGFVPAIGLGYANNLVLGSLQKFGNTGSFADQVVQKGAIGVGEQAIADTGISAIDEFLPKAYKTDTRYGVLGNLARGEAGEGMKNATVQMFTFSLFAGLHGKQPDAVKEAFRENLSAQFKSGLSPEQAAKTADIPRQVIADQLARNPELTPAEAKKAVDAAMKGLPRPVAEANSRYGYALADALPDVRQAGAANPENPLTSPRIDPNQKYLQGAPRANPLEIRPGSLLGKEKPALSPEGERLTPEEAAAVAKGPEGMPPLGEQVSPPTPAEPAKSAVERLTPEERKQVAAFFGLASEKAFKGELKSPAKAKGYEQVAERIIAERNQKPVPKPAEAAPRPEPAPRAPDVTLRDDSLVHGDQGPVPSRRQRMSDRLKAAAAPVEQGPSPLNDVLKDAGVSERATPDRFQSDTTRNLDYGDRYMTVEHLPESNNLKIDFGYEQRLGGFTGGGQGGLAKHTEALLRDLQKIIGAAKEKGLGIEYKAASGEVNKVSGRVKQSGRASLYERALTEAGFEKVGEKTEDGSGYYVWKPKAQPQVSAASTEAAPAPVDRMAKARARTAEAVAQTAAIVTPRPERALTDAEQGEKLKQQELTYPERKEERTYEGTPYESLPGSVRESIEPTIARIAQMKGWPLDSVRDSYRVAYVDGGREAVMALAELHEATLNKRPTDAQAKAASDAAIAAKKAADNARTEANQHLTGRVEANQQSSDARTRLFKSEESRAAEYAANRERYAKLIADAEAEGVHRATEVANGRNPEKETVAGKPRPAAGAKLGRRLSNSNLLPEHLRGKPISRDHMAVIKAAEGFKGDSREAIQTALHNMRGVDSETASLAPVQGASRERASKMGRRRNTVDSLGRVYEDSLKEGKPAVAADVLKVLKKFDTEVKTDAGKRTEFDGRYYDSETPMFTGDKAEVIRPALVMSEGGRDYVARKGLVKEAAKGAERTDNSNSLLAHIRSIGGLDEKSMTPGEAARLHDAKLGHVFRTDNMRLGTHAIDTLAEQLRNDGYLEKSNRVNPEDQLIQALLENKQTEHTDDAVERELREHWKNQEMAAREQGDTTEWKPSEEEIPFATEPGKELLGKGQVSAATTEKGGGAFDIIAAQNKLFDVRNYVEKSTPYNRDALAVALREQKATVTSKAAAGDPLVNLHEHAHHLQKGLGIPDSPSQVPLQIARGAEEFHRPGGKGNVSRMSMIEGFASWMVQRATGNLTNLSPSQEAASRYFEKQVQDKGLAPALDKVKGWIGDYMQKSPAAQAAGNVSATGRPAEAPKTLAEVSSTVGQKAQEWVDNNLSVLQRLTNSARKLGHKIGIGEDPYTVTSQLMHADKGRAAEFERDGVHTYIDGRKQVIGQSFAKITEGAKPEWLKPGANGEASRAGVYAVARHVLGEESRGRTDLVSPVQLEQYRAALQEFAKDAEFSTWAEGFTKNLTEAFNASRRALAGKDVHFLTPEEVAEWEKKYPDYIPTDRVMQDAGWRQPKGTRGEGPAKITAERSGSGEQIIDPLISYKNRLRITSAVMGEQLKRIAVEKVLKLEGMGNWAVAGEGKLTDLGKQRAEVLQDFGFKGEELTNLLKSMGLERAEEYFTTRPWPTDGTKPTWGLKGPDGKLVNYRIGDKALYDLITGQQVEANALASWVRAIGQFYPVKLMTQAVKFGATSASLGFQFRNSPRDIYTFWANTIDRMKANPKDLGSAFARSYAFAWHQLTGHFGGAASTDVLFRRFEQDRGDTGRQFDFSRDKPETAYGPNRSKVVETAHSIWGVFKDTLRLAGAGELAPRFLEWKTRLEQTTGKSAAELTKELEAYEQDASKGKYGPDPIPLNIALDAMNAASEVTVNFNRLGTVTREINKITPFFGPAIAGLSKNLRNWKDNPKGAAFAMSGLLALRLIHWLTYSDEDWYKELNSNDRFNNFVVPTPAGLRRFPAPRDLEVAGGAFLTTALDAVAHKDPDFKGALKESFFALAPPAPVPPAGKVGYELARNENWMGSPIVPKRDEGKSVADKWKDDRLPYVADQMTGGLLSERKIPTTLRDAIPYSEVKNARRSVDEFFDHFHELEQGHQKATRQGVRYESEAEYQRMEKAQQQLVTVGRAIRGERLVNGRVQATAEPVPPATVEMLRQKQVQIARKALGKE